ncbi:MAG TPA: hypothetical protein PLU58_15725 [Saprospiraceae bacterium]|nr:hypothetical protein [Saprospiraceae bacterium]
MTAQRTDTIIINKDEHKMYGLPLEQYWMQNDNKPPLFSMTTSLNRGYYAKWLIENNKLFLIDFYGECLLPPPIKEYSLIDLFPSAKGKVFAEWFTGDIIIPMGKQVNYFHGGWGATHEYSTTIKFCDGLIIDSGSFVTE